MSKVEYFYSGCAHKVIALEKCGLCRIEELEAEKTEYPCGHYAERATMLMVCPVCERKHIEELETRAKRHRKEMTHLLDRNVALRKYLETLRANTHDHDLKDEIDAALAPPEESK